MVALLCRLNILHILIGVSIVRDQLDVGANAVASCFSDGPATRIEWLHNGVVVESAISTQQADLVFSPVNDSIHNQIYVCRVTREGGVLAEQNFTAVINGNYCRMLSKTYCSYLVVHAKYLH